VWKVEVNGLLVDIRRESREKQEEALQKGLIPYIPADREQGTGNQSKKPQDMPDLASFEANVLGALFGFYKKTIALLRQSSLNDEKKKLVGERICQLMEDATEEMKRSRDWNLAGRLDSAYEEVKRLVDELSDPHGGHSGTPSQSGDASA
jgi:hypothetical protein